MSAKCLAQGCSRVTKKPGGFCWQHWEMGREPEPAMSDRKDSPMTDIALATFTEYFVKNYPGPDTIIGRPEWHAPKIFRAAEYAMSLRAPPSAPAEKGEFDMRAHLQRQREWSERTFGPGNRTAGVVDHIRKELREIEADPADVSEWIDVVILALDGAWRAGYSPDQIIAAIVAKQTKNEGRVWPDWRSAAPDKAIEHDRSHDAALAPPDAEGVPRECAHPMASLDVWSNAMRCCYCDKLIPLSEWAGPPSTQRDAHEAELLRRETPSDKPS